MSQTLCLLPPPHVWDTNHASCPLPVGLTLVSPTMCISGIDHAQKLKPKSGSHDEETYARLLGVRHIQTRRCVRITNCSRQSRRAGMPVHGSVYPLTAHQPLAGTWRDMCRGRLVG